MKLTTKGRFAVTAMVDLALHLSEAPVRIALIAERQNLSVAYLEQIFCKLRRAGLVTSARGPGGGYRLGDLPENISVGQIIEAVDEDIDATQCHGGDTCKGGAACLTHHLWEDLNRVTSDFLSRRHGSPQRGARRPQGSARFRRHSGSAPQLICFDPDHY